ncbi:hypothetical protein RJT34_31454 [Clitoria ternatea]|uniref:Uncharacterized protein n=1 Tax=Clitoria ternatea TaxID=43366 RepID=A0AAN9I2W7_CLITE
MVVDSVFELSAHMIRLAVLLGEDRVNDERIDVADNFIFSCCFELKPIAALYSLRDIRSLLILQCNIRSWPLNPRILLVK